MILLALLVFIAETAMLVGVTCTYAIVRHELTRTLQAKETMLHAQEVDLHEASAKLPRLRADLQKVRSEEKYWENRYAHERADSYAKTVAVNKMKPFNLITGLKAHAVPQMYGKVKEKTIWAFWYHPVNCRRKDECKLPPVVELCVETIEKNRGGFDFRIVHMDEVDKYVTRIELPIRWSRLSQAQQKDALMNALLSRYGGVALDISTLLLRPLDDYWNSMVSQGATFQGYMYRINGQPWRHAESTSVFFLMSRREGIFTTAVRNQLIGMGDRPDTGAYHHWYLALGDQTLTPILHMFNYSLPTCTKDPSILKPPPTAAWDQNATMCPELELKWHMARFGTARNDTKVLLHDPRDGPQLPFAFGKGMALWNTTDSTSFTDDQIPASTRDLGGPMQDETCGSPKECWENVFLQRYNAPVQPGGARVLNFVKLFAHAKELTGMSREHMLNLEGSYFQSWLRLAGVTK